MDIILFFIFFLSSLSLILFAQYIVVGFSTFNRLPCVQTLFSFPSLLPLFIPLTCSVQAREFNLFESHFPTGKIHYFFA